MFRICNDRFTWICLSFMIGFSLLNMAGCGPGDNRQSLTGTVSWQGKPLPRGVITFYPKGQGSTVGCEIIDGKFLIEMINGATLGKYRVEIVAFRPTGKSEFDIDQNKQVSIEEQYLPKQFNSDSILDAEVVGNKSNTFEFDLKPSK